MQSLPKTQTVSSTSSSLHSTVLQTPIAFEPQTYELEFETSLKHSNATQNVYFANYFEWQGHAREKWFMDCVQPDLLQSQGVFVTVKAHNQFIREAQPFQRIQCRVNSFDIKRTSFSLRFSFYIDGQLASEGYQRICFTSHTKSLKARLPDDVVQKIRRYEVIGWAPQSDPARVPPVRLDPARPPANRRWSTEFRTTLKHSNATQNVYFSNYFDWQGAAREQWFFDMIDETMLRDAGVFVTAIAHNDYKKEAFPFQKIRCEIYTFNILRCSFYIGFEFFLGDELISSGYQKLVFADHRKRPARLPEFVVNQIRTFEKV